MHAVLLSLLVLAVPPAKLDASEVPKARLFVRTKPPGATIAMDGKELGKSDSLFVVPPGTHKITIELDGHASEARTIAVDEGRIARVEVELRKSADSAPPPTGGASGASGADGSAAATALLARGAVPAALRQSMLTVLRQHPTETRWSGRDGETLFALAVKPLPKGQTRQRVTGAFLELVQMLAVQEMLTAKSLLDRYAATGLSDATTLRQAVENAAGQLQVTGQVHGVTQQAALQDEFAAAYVLGDQAALSAHLLRPTELEKVQAAYREVMHRQARDLMARSNWTDALALWRHLHQRKLVSPLLYLDAARCFQKLGQSADATRVLNEAVDAFGASAHTEFFEQAGDLAIEIETPEAQTLAERAYRRAIDLLKETVSGPTP
jgi:hypothetical protein